MRPVDAAPTDLETVRRILREHAPDLEVRAFGSRVSWTARETSDLDLTLMTNEPLDAARMAVLRSAFSDSRLPFRVDIVDWAGVSDSFRKVIESEYVTLVGKGERRSGEGWTTMTLGRFAPLAYGKGLKSDVRNSSGHVPVFGSNGQVGWHDKALTDGPTVIVGRKGTVGSVHYSPEPCWPIDTTFFISDDDTELMRFKYYALNALDLETMNTDSAVPGLNRSAFHAREIRTPPLPEQRAIAGVLGALDDKIGLNRRMNETLEAMDRALFKSWFVDFDPVRAKAEGRDTGLPGHIVDLFPDRLVDSELGKIPEGWGVGNLADISAASRQGVDPANLDGDTPYIGLEHMPRRSISLTDWGSARKVTSNKSIFRKGDILFGKLRPYFHKVGIVPINGVCSTDIVVIVPKTTEWSAFVTACVSSVDFVDYTDRSSTGTKMPRTNWKTMSGYRICLPETPVIRAFQNVVQPILDRIIANIHEARSLATLRDMTLPKLVSGELRLGEAVERLESAA